MPPILTQTVLVLLGITLGSLVSRQLIQHMSAYPLTIALLALATFCMTFGSSFYLQRFHGWDPTSALLAASPGALSQITILAAEKGADVPAIAVVQTMRVIILTAALPLVLALTGIAPTAPPVFASIVASPLELAALIAAAIAVALLLRLAKFPASWMFGAMIASSVLHGTSLIEGGLPPWMRGVALVGIGAVIGTRFSRIKKSTLLSHVNAGLGSFAVAIVISAIFVAVILLTTNVRFADVSLPSRRVRWTPCWRWRSRCISIRSSSAPIICRGSCSFRLRRRGSFICSDGRRRMWTIRVGLPCRRSVRSILAGATTRASYPAKAGYPVRRGLSVQS